MSIFFDGTLVVETNLSEVINFSHLLNFTFIICERPFDKILL